MTAPRSVCRNTKQALAERRPSIHDGKNFSVPRPVLYDICHIKIDREPAMTDQTVAAIAPSHQVASTVPQIAVLAALAATGTLATNILLPRCRRWRSLERFERGGHLRDHGFPRGVCARPARGRADLGSLRPALAGADGICGVLAGSIWCGLRPRPAGLLIGRASRLPAPARPRCCRAPSPAISSAAPRWPRDGADHDRHGGGARLFAAAGRRARSLFRLALRIRFCRGFRRDRRHRL